MVKETTKEEVLVGVFERLIAISKGYQVGDSREVLEFVKAGGDRELSTKRLAAILAMVSCFVGTLPEVALGLVEQGLFLSEACDHFTEEFYQERKKEEVGV